jgi:anti-anti-sigma factor
VPTDGSGVVNVVVTPPSQPSAPHVLSISGELDVVSLPDVLDLVPTLVAEAAGVVVDLRDVSFLDSSGVRFLHRLAHSCAAAGTGMRVVAPPECRARRVLDIVGMTLLVDDDLDTARTALQGPGAPGPA